MPAAGQEIRQRPHIASSLGVALSQKRPHTAAAAPDVTGQQSQVEQRLDALLSPGLLHDPAAEDDRPLVRPGVKPRSEQNLLPGDSCCRRGLLRGQASGGVEQSFIVFCFSGDEFPVGQLFVDDDPGHGAQQRQVGPHPGAQPAVRKEGQLCFPRIDENQFGPVQLHGALNPIAHQRSRGRRIGADNHDHIGPGQIIQRVGDPRKTDGIIKAPAGGAVVKAAAVIDIVRPQHRTGKSLQQIIFFIGAVGCTEYGHALRAACRTDSGESCRRGGQSLLPGNLFEGAVFFEQRPGEPLGAVNKVAAVTSPDTEGPRT